MQKLYAVAMSILHLLLLSSGHETSPEADGVSTLYARLLREDDSHGSTYPCQLYFDEPRWPAIRGGADTDTTPRGGAEIVQPLDGSTVYIDHSMQSKPLAFILQLSLYVTSVLQVRFVRLC